MITATVTVTTTSTSVYDLINTAIPNKLNVTNNNGRIAEIQIHWLTGLCYLFDIPGTVNDGAGAGPEVSTNAGYAIGDPTSDPSLEKILVLRQAGGMNALSLKSLYLGTATAATVRITSYSI